MSDSSSSVEALFFAALEKDPVAERALYLDAVCGRDSEVRRKVDRLLRAHSKVGDFLTRPVVEQFDVVEELSNSKSGLSGNDVDDGDVVDVADDSDDRELDFLHPSTRPDALGRIGHFEVLEVLGRGGFGIVFRGLDEKLQRAVAIKVLVPRLARRSVARERFLDEARSSARIRHVNVVQVYSVEEQTMPYLVMELIPGESLQQRLCRTGRFEAMEVARIGHQVAEGLAAAHASGLIHRDVKPENILLEKSSEEQPGRVHVKISDFGLARAADDATMSQYGIAAGTPMFMAPEQAAGEALDHRADLFSLGSVLYTLCCGHGPFRGKSTFAILRRVVEETPEPIENVVPETPKWLCEIIARLQAKKPEDRFASAREVADLLNRHLIQMDKSDGTAPLVEADIHVDAPAPLRNPESKTTNRAWRGITGRRWAAAAVLTLMLLGAIGLTEATGVTDFRGTVIRLFSSEGTLVIEVDDPGVSVRIDGRELVILGAGTKEIRLKPGRYAVEVSKDGQFLSRQLVSVTRNGHQVVRISHEPPPRTKDNEGSTTTAAWERSVSAMSKDDQATATLSRLKELNPGFDDARLDWHRRFVMRLRGTELRDISPLRAMSRMTSLFINGPNLTDLTPLRGLPLTRLALDCPRVSDLSALELMPLTELNLGGSKSITDLSPLRGMPLKHLTIAYTQVRDLSPLIGLKLKLLNCDSTPVTDLSPLKGMPLEALGIHKTKVSDFSLLRELPLTHLQCDQVEIGAAELAIIKDCKKLKFLTLNGVKLTAADFDALQKALPDCEIRWDGKPEAR